MKTMVQQFKQFILTAVFLCIVLPAIAQRRHKIVTSQRNDFYQLLKDAGLNFTFPHGFKEIKAINNEYFSFDYAMEKPGDNFEVWLQIKSQKQNWKSYVKDQESGKTDLANPDSMYRDMGRAAAIALSGGTNFFERSLPYDIAERYGADAGRSYLVTLLDMDISKHYKYALVVAAQKNHAGTIVLVFLTNYKDADFYRNISIIGHSFKFIP
jgi:hypothetical protein